MNDPRRFKVMDGHEDLLGGALTRDNAYISMYPALLDGEKPIDDLEPFERSRARFSLSGSSGVYSILRVEDAKQ